MLVIFAFFLSGIEGYQGIDSPCQSKKGEERQLRDYGAGGEELTKMLSRLRSCA